MSEDKKLGTKVLEFMKLRAKATKKQKEVDAIKSEASTLEKEIIIMLEDDKNDRAGCRLGGVKISKNDVFSAKDWKKVWAYIFKQKDSGLVQKRLSQALLKEYLEDGLKIPGVERMVQKKLTLGWKKG